MALAISLNKKLQPDSYPSDLLAKSLGVGKDGDKKSPKTEMRLSSLAFVGAEGGRSVYSAILATTNVIQQPSSCPEACF